MPIPQVGDPAPDFELPATGDRSIRLSDFLGQKNVVLAFYPFDWSPTCSLQLPGLQQRLGDFRSLDTEVLGISIDSRHSHRAFAEHLGLEFPLLSDFEKRVTQAYGVLREGGFAERALFVVDKRGILRYAHVNAIGEVPDNEPMFAVLRQLERAIV
jgi:peroxiredoxin (alkyl hydroperoxide reductase subunit C)